MPIKPVPQNLNQDKVGIVGHKVSTTFGAK
jgi:hypothetical protein